MRDAQGHELSGATIEAVGYFDRAVRAFALIYGDAAGLYETIPVCEDIDVIEN